MKKRFLFLTVIALLCTAFTSCALFKKECEHSYTEKVVAPTCVAEGYTEHTCSKCGDSYKDVPTQKVAHPYKNVVVSPTCAAEGYTEHTCTVCGDSYKDTTVAKVSHDYKAEVVSPTCSEEGYTKHTCTVCGDSYKDTAVAKIPHDYKAEVVSPTCSEEGYTKHTCTVCGDDYKDTFVEKIPHTYGAEIVAPTCTAEGYTKHTCTVCGDSYNDTETIKTAHRFNGSPCKYCGMEEITESITPDTEWYSSEKSSFLISTPAQFAGFASLVNSGTTFSGKSVYLDSDIDLGYYEWIPIGNSGNAFAGAFSGEGYSVYGLKINASAAYAGLFGNSTGKITNLNITNATVYSGDNYNYVSIACGYSGGEISDVSVSGYIDAKISSYVAGVVGFTSAVIKNCTNNAEIVADGYVGGIAGLSSNTISYCTNSGNISGKAFYVGGIVGNVENSAELTFKNLGNTGNITGVSCVGGIFGRLYQVNDACATSQYEKTAKYTGITGATWAYYHKYRYTTTLDNLENTGDVNASDVQVGGIVGYAYFASNYNQTKYHCSSSGGSDWMCNLQSNFRIVATNLSSTGAVSACGSVGELFGYFNADLDSPLTTYTVTGSVTVNGEVKEGNCDVGSNNNLTLSGREIYVPEESTPEK